MLVSFASENQTKCSLPVNATSRFLMVCLPRPGDKKCLYNRAHFKTEILCNLLIISPYYTEHYYGFTRHTLICFAKIRNVPQYMNIKISGFQAAVSLSLVTLLIILKA
jgi:hypothetical protein